ncbi:hypothetical protein BGZ65_001558 [Modicella reniformis]|uniref:Uncharacterized protein n=1 Tax=Modicella reniformis TaxID=1440133 RepID=A0A9P6M0W1_9FUNG|nr:hypothetical protein BGZ65_001558 [Modicella reniformis]
MDPTFSLARCAFPVLETTNPEDLPVARLWVEKYNDLNDTFFPLYKGRNPVGSNPHVVKAYIPEKYHINEVHVLIDIDQVAKVQDPFPRDSDAKTKLGDDVLMPEKWLEFPSTKKLQLMGAIELWIEFLPEEEQQKGPFRSELLPSIAKARDTYSLEDKLYHPMRRPCNMTSDQRFPASQESCPSVESPEYTMSISSLTESACSSVDSTSQETSGSQPSELRSHNSESVFTSHDYRSPIQFMSEGHSFDNMESNDYDSDSSEASTLIGSQEVPQEVFQVISGYPSDQTGIFDERIPGFSPPDLIDNFGAASQENLNNVDLRKTRKQIIEERDKASQVQEDKQATAVSEISASKTHGEPPDKSFGSLLENASGNSLSQLVKGEEETSTVDKTRKEQDDRGSCSKESTKEMNASERQNEDEIRELGIRNSQEECIRQEDLRSSQVVENDPQKDSQKLSSLPTDESSSKGTSSRVVEEPHESTGRTLSTLSPKHGMQFDADESPHKPFKLMKTENS